MGAGERILAAVVFLLAGFVCLALGAGTVAVVLMGTGCVIAIAGIGRRL